MERPRYYILQNGEPFSVEDVLVWAGWFEEADRQVVRTEISPDCSVSTVFLGLDHQYGDGPPLIFETMIFGGPHDQYQERYATRADAERGHARACAVARGGS